MKKILMLLSALAAWCGGAWADGLTVQNISIPQGGEATLEVSLENLATEFAAFQFNVELAEGITVALNAKGKLDFVKGERLADEDGFTLSMSQPDPEENVFRVLGYYTETQPIPGTSGTIVKVTLKADASLEVDAVLECKLSAINLTETDETKHTPEDIAFTITVGAPADTRTVLDETSTTAPEASDGAVDVRVKRVIHADEWSTICLPFAMTAEQVTAAFGEDVLLANFTGIETEEDTEENIVAINVKFETATAIEANHPYLIKVSAPVEEFTVDGVDVEPDEASVDCDRIGAGTKRDPYRWNSFVGTYVAGTEVPEQTLFLSDNKFWYSTGATVLKAFRGYFDFYDVLTEVEEGNAATGVRFSFDGETTGIVTMDKGQGDYEDGCWYTLDGRRLNGQPVEKGMYIQNGKKVMKN